MARKIDRRNSVKVVIQNDFIKVRASRDMDANAQKFLRIAIAQSKITDKEFFMYEVSATELADMFGVSQSNIYHHIDKWTSQCMGTVMEFRASTDSKFRKFALFSMCEYDNGILRMKLNPDMTPFVLEIQKQLGFTQYELSNILTVKGKYTIRIYEMMMAEMKSQKAYANRTVEFDLSMEELRRQTGTEKLYKQIGQFKDRVLSKAIEEIEKAQSWKIETENVKTGRNITAIHFKVWSEIGFANRNRIREMTPEEKREYDELTAHSKQMDMEDLL